jgi:TonB-linked SusC/RagA family outer membrane protein
MLSRALSGNRGSRYNSVKSNKSTNPNKNMKFFRCFRHTLLCARNRPTKPILVMKLSVLLILISYFQVTATVYAQKISFTVSQQPIAKVFEQIQKQSGYIFFYDENSIKNANAVTLAIKEKNIKETLDQVFEGQPLIYEMVKRTIVVKQKPNIPEKTKEKQNKQPLTGIVIDENGQPLVGASVSIKGTSQTIMTNREGKYTFSDIADNAVLIVTYVGYISQDVSFKNATKITLQRSDSKLDDVQIIAYGTTTKRLNTGSVATVSAKDIERQPVSNPLATLEGRVPGLIITQSTGVPGGGFKIELRGRTALDRTITDDQPLIIIDGIPVASNNNYLSQLSSSIGTPSSQLALQPGGITALNNLNPKDIASIEVLKDADATAIYGSRGANGVILITTKVGSQGKTKVELNSYVGLSYVSNRIEMMDTKQYLDYRRKAFSTEATPMNNSNAYDILLWDTERYTDISQLFLGNTATNKDVQLSLSGGNENTKFLAGGNLHDETTLSNDNLGEKRTGFHFNISHNSIDNRFKAVLTGNYSQTKNNVLTADLASLLILSPNIKLYEQDGSLAWNEGGVNVGQINPMSNFKRTASTQTNYLTGNLMLSYEIIKNLSLKTNLGYNTINVDESQQFPRTAQNPLSSPNRYSYFANSDYAGWIVEPQLEYNKNVFKGKMNILIGSTFQANKQFSENLTATGYSSDDLLNGFSGATSITGTKGNSPYKYNAIFGRLGYNWDQKYLLNITARRDGSSRFAPENRFANFGALGGAWIISEEKWFQNLKSIFSFLKLRGSYGITGNDKISNYQFLDTWATPRDGYEGNAVLYPDKLYNPEYRWEKTIKKELALEFSMFKDRLYIAANYFRNTSSNQLISYRLASVAGFTSIIRNFPAVVQNDGLEISAQSTNINSKIIKWTTSLNITLPKNKLKSFPNLASSSYSSRYVEGESLDLIYRYKYMGVDKQTGLFTVEDINGDGILNVNDYQVLGNTNPKIYGGLQNSISYKGFEVDFLFSFRKQTGENYLKNISSLGNVNNLPASLSNEFWEQPRDDKSLQRLSPLTTGTTRNAFLQFSGSNGIYSDASFIRLKNASLSYNLTDRLLKSRVFSNAKIYVQGQNLFTITSYEIGDPETQNWLRTPPLTTLVFGVQLSL